jgi:Ca2+-binding EF-hand superfamily protein
VQSVRACARFSRQSFPEAVQSGSDDIHGGQDEVNYDSTLLAKSLSDGSSFDGKKSSSDIGAPNPQPSPAFHDRSAMRTFEALVSPQAPQQEIGRTKTLPRMLFRRQTVGLRGRLDANGIPDQKLQDVTKTFHEYDVDSNGRLSMSEFNKLLKDQGMSIEGTDIAEAVAMVLPEGSSSLLSSPNGVDLQAFTELVAHGVRAEALREEQYCGYSVEQAGVLRDVFDLYDGNHSGVLEANEIGQLLEDMGQAPTTFSEQEELHDVLKKILGGSLRPLQFRDFLEFAKILETTSIGSGGKAQHEKKPEHRRSSDLDLMQVARRAGFRMADVLELQGIFNSDANSDNMLRSTELYDLLKSRLRLKAAEGEREMHVHSIIKKHEGSTGAFDFEDFLVIVGDLVDAKLATVSSILGREDRSTKHFLGHLAALLE